VNARENTYLYDTHINMCTSTIQKEELQMRRMDTAIRYNGENTYGNSLYDSCKFSMHVEIHQNNIYRKVNCADGAVNEDNYHGKLLVRIYQY
jgi:hypothetical protein